MTRKMALISAIEMIKKYNKEEQEVIDKLEEILSENPFHSWTKNSIIDSIITYADEHGNTLPKVSDLITANKLPSITVIEAKFGMHLTQFYKKYFPHLNKQNNNSSPYRLYDEEYFLSIFKENYERIKKEKKVRYVSARLYDKNRMQGTPIIYTIMRQCGVSTYKGLLVMCEYKKDIKELQSSIHVTYVD